MPALTEKQKEHIKRFIEEKWDSTDCPMCRANDWRIMGPIAILTNPDETLPVNQFLFIQEAALICDNCGHTLFVSLKHAGVPQP